MLVLLNFKKNLKDFSEFFALIFFYICCHPVVFFLKPENDSSLLFTVTIIKLFLPWKPVFFSLRKCFVKQILGPHFLSHCVLWELWETVVLFESNRASSDTGRMTWSIKSRYFLLWLKSTKATVLSSVVFPWIPDERCEKLHFPAGISLSMCCIQFLQSHLNCPVVRRSLIYFKMLTCS